MNTTDTIITGDCLAVLPTLPAGYAHLAYLDPPFDIGLPYPGYLDRLPEGEYLAWLRDVLRASSACCRRSVRSGFSAASVLLARMLAA